MHKSDYRFFATHDIRRSHCDATFYSYAVCGLAPIRDALSILNRRDVTQKGQIVQHTGLILSLRFRSRLEHSQKRNRTMEIGNTFSKHKLVMVDRFCSVA
jgi:hypothetical protein